MMEAWETIPAGKDSGRHMTPKEFAVVKKATMGCWFLQKTCSKLAHYVIINLAVTFCRRQERPEVAAKFISDRIVEAVVAMEQ